MFILVQDLKKCSAIQRDNAKQLYTTHLKEHGLKCCHLMGSNLGSWSEFQQFMSAACVNKQIVRFDLHGYGKVTVFQPGVCPKFRIEF